LRWPLSIMPDTNDAAGAAGSRWAERFAGQQALAACGTWCSRCGVSTLL
jgi:hypothetical protein